MSALRSVRDVAERHLCSGCGVCAFVAPEDVHMVDDLRQGRRPLTLTPVPRPGTPAEDALRACPGRALAHQQPLPQGHLHELGPEWGPVLEVWEGWAADPVIRYRGSSGGVATALSVHGIERGGLAGVLHTAARKDVPYLNETVLSTDRHQLVERTGSRYAPASPCDGLQKIVDADGPCAFVGKPCDVAGAVNAAAVRPQLASRLALTVAVFCAGTPTTNGTLEAVAKLGLDPQLLSRVQYRGEGWPGRFTAQETSGRTGSLSYEESWGDILQKHRQWRCMVCVDHSGEFADVSVGDPWYRPTEGDPGRSLVLVRTERGRAAVRRALEDGAVVLWPAAPGVLPASQRNLVRTRGAVWGRVLTMRLLGLPAPRYRNMPMLRAWLRLSGQQKLQSTLGTSRRLRARGLVARRPVEPWESSSRDPAADPGGVSPPGGEHDAGSGGTGG